MALPTFIVDGVYDFQKLHDVVKVVVGNLNKIIDVNYCELFFPSRRVSFEEGRSETRG